MKEEKLKQLEIVIRTILDKYFGKDHYPLTIDKATNELIYEVKIRINNK